LQWPSQTFGQMNSSVLLSMIINSLDAGSSVNLGGMREKTALPAHC